MNTEELVALHQRMCDKAREIMRAKNHDYSGTKKTFANFDRVSVMDICTVEQGFFVRMCDKFSRLITLTQEGVTKVKDESFEDTLVDFINYPILFAGWLAEQREKQNETILRNAARHHGPRRRSQRAKRPHASIASPAISSRLRRRVSSRNDKGIEV